LKKDFDGFLWGTSNSFAASDGNKNKNKINSKPESNAKQNIVNFQPRHIQIMGILFHLQVRMKFNSSVFESRGFLGMEKNYHVGKGALTMVVGGIQENLDLHCKFLNSFVSR